MTKPIPPSPRRLHIHVLFEALALCAPLLLAACAMTPASTPSKGAPPGAPASRDAPAAERSGSLTAAEVERKQHDCKSCHPASVPSFGAVVAKDGCGADGDMCPLQKFMRKTMVSGVVSGDMASLARSFDALATMAPAPSWNGAHPGSDWGAMAKAGEIAAQANDAPRVTAACKSCHDSFMKRYRAEFRPKKID